MEIPEEFSAFLDVRVGEFGKNSRKSLRTFKWRVYRDNGYDEIKKEVDEYIKSILNSNTHTQTDKNVYFKPGKFSKQHEMVALLECVVLIIYILKVKLL